MKGFIGGIIIGFTAGTIITAYKLMKKCKEDGEVKISEDEKLIYVKEEKEEMTEQQKEKYEEIKAKVMIEMKPYMKKRRINLFIKQLAIMMMFLNLGLFISCKY